MHHEQSHETARALVAPFYDVLTRPSQKNVAAIVSEIAIPEWRSYAGETVSKGREEFIAQVIFFGVPHSGRSFKIMTIDIHTVKDGKLVTAHHVEDWASALRQLAGK